MIKHMRFRDMQIAKELTEEEKKALERVAQSLKPREKRPLNKTITVNVQGFPSLAAAVKLREFEAQNQ